MLNNATCKHNNVLVGLAENFGSNYQPLMKVKEGHGMTSGQTKAHAEMT